MASTGFQLTTVDTALTTLSALLPPRFMPWDSGARALF
jgi:hypothetical protein